MSELPEITPERRAELWDMGTQAIRELESDHGIFASSRQEIYGCIFGRDSLITSLFLLRVYEKNKDEYLLSLVKKVLMNLAELQGTHVNIESGEEPGKCIHEFRPERHEHLTQDPNHPWYIYPDGIMRNYDTVDATPLFLLCIHKYYELSKDTQTLAALMPHVHSALQWLLTFADSNGDGLIDYQFNPSRKYGGLRVQSWMDSTESLFFEEGDIDVPAYSVSPLEVQGYAYAALRYWSDYFAKDNETLSQQLNARATELREITTLKFVPDTGNIAFALDGAGRPLISTRSSIGHLLWSAYIPGASGNVDLGASAEPEGVLAHSYRGTIVRRLMEPDMFVPNAGIRTLSSNSSGFEVNSYHNGSIWPHDTMIVAEGMRQFGCETEAKKVRAALLRAYDHYNTPVELFTYGTPEAHAKDPQTPEGYGQYRSPNGQGACRVQAWSAAALLALLISE